MSHWRRTIVLAAILVLTRMVALAARSASLTDVHNLPGLTDGELLAKGDYYANKKQEMDSAFVCYTLVANRYHDKKANGDNTRNCILAQRSIGLIYLFDYYDFPNAYLSFLKAKECAEADGHRDLLPDILLNIAVIEGEQTMLMYNHSHTYNKEVFMLFKQAFQAARQQRQYATMVLCMLDLLSMTTSGDHLNLIGEEMRAVMHDIPDSIKPYITQRLNALSIDYARTVVGANYWMFYTVEGGDSICAATSITAAGPYTNRGAIMHAADVNSTTLSHPFFIVASNAFYLCYTTDDGTYIQRLRLNRVTGVSKQGAATKIAATGVTDVSIVRKSSSVFYMLFTVKNGESTEIHYARASKITGPYLDKSGNDVATSSAGETLITASDNIINPERPMRGFINQAGDYLFVAHNATEQGKETMQSGYARRPLFVTPVQIGEDEWLTATQVKKGWTKPRFE